MYRRTEVILEHKKRESNRTILEAVSCLAYADIFKVIREECLKVVEGEE